MIREEADGQAFVPSSPDLRPFKSGTLPFGGPAEALFQTGRGHLPLIIPV